jgi:hypothetical protein
MNHANRRLMAATLVLVACGMPPNADGQEAVLFPRAQRYDGHQASQDATNRGNAARLNMAARQLDAIDYVRQIYGRPFYFDHRIYYAWGQGTPRYLQAIEQPIGQWSGQVAPGRWESHPIYARDLRHAPNATQSPPPPTSGPREF